MKKKSSNTAKKASAPKKVVKPAAKSAAKPAPKKAPAKKPAVVKAKSVVKAKPKAKVAPIPKGYNSITPYLIVSNATKAIDFYVKSLGAKEVMRMDKPGGKIGHAELKIGDTKIMLSDACPEMGMNAPQSGAPCSICIHLYTKNVDATIKQAVDNGAKLIRPAEDMFYGDRIGMIADPFGHSWSIASHVEDVSKATLKKRAAEMYSKGK